MSVFVYRGPLAPNSLLFCGRTAELTRLIRLCQGEVRAYAIVYGGRQTGKTSLLLQLSTRLQKSASVCRVDFQGLPGATTPQVYAYLAQRIARSLSFSSSIPDINDSPGLTEFLCQMVNRSEIDRFVLLFEELGALPQTTREDLANVIRSIFTNRFDASYCPLGKIMIIVAGSIELYELAATQVSTLHNICEAIYLPNLSQDEAVSLVANGLLNLGVSQSQAAVLGQTIYHHVGGHPYLTQRLGGALESILTNGEETLTPAHADDAIEQLLKDDPLLYHLRRALSQQGLLTAGRDLLDGHLRFSRLDEEMAQLELLGLAYEADGHWAVRNRLLSRALQDWITATSKSTSPTGQEITQNRATYNININQGQSIAIGDQARLTNNSIDETEEHTDNALH